MKDQIVAWLLRLTVREHSTAVDDEVFLDLGRVKRENVEFLQHLVTPYKGLPDSFRLLPATRPQITLAVLVDALLLLDEQGGGYMNRTVLIW